MVGQSSGYLESLPAAVKTRIACLEQLQDEYDDLEAKMEDEIKQIEKKYAALQGTSTGRMKI